LAEFRWPLFGLRCLSSVDQGFLACFFAAVPVAAASGVGSGGDQVGFPGRGAGKERELRFESDRAGRMILIDTFSL
jgi:hypothetical protein